MEIKDKIVEGAGQLFHKYGIRSVSMDDIARHLSMSKKTLYQYFKDKDDLVTTSMKVLLEEEKEQFKAIEKQSVDALQEMAMFTNCMRKNMKDTSAALLFDLQKYHPNAWRVWTDFKNEFTKNYIVRNLVRGIEEGLFRKEIDPETMAILRVEQVEMAFDDRIYPSSKFDFRQIQVAFFDHFVHGLVTEEGRKTFLQYMEQENDTKTNSILPHEN
ncbi:MAG: TetR/AcrR family transcriptional regulator [Cytophagales bacterium]|nr:TetR/AcrR family transcriptional regulator [Cytophagales bacterium]